MFESRLFIIGAVLFVLCFWFTAPPFSFPTDSIITVPEGAGLYILSEELKQDKVIRSPFWFRVVAIVLDGERLMRAGQYYMSRPQNAFIIAWRMFHGDYDVETVKLTIPEGFTVEEISALFDDRFVSFDNKSFALLAPEGYLFPDTYFIPVIATASSTIKLMQDNFSRQILTLTDDIKKFNKPLKDVIIMASILEAEIQEKGDREIVSGILWKRISLGMPLQVDSEPKTYESIGFPERPINNPGLVSIEAALHPTTTPYLYFLTDKDGNPHYSRTFEEHVAKKLTYLKN